MSTTVRLQETFKFALAMTLTYGLILAMDWDLTKYAALAVVIVSLDTTGATLNKGLARLGGTVVGVVAGWALLAAFYDDRWLMMAGLATYVVVCSYFMQRSRVPYAWYMITFVAVCVWHNSYEDLGNAFHFGAFRLLETAAGVGIYTLVAALLWPRSAGDEVAQHGGRFWAAARQMLAAACRPAAERAGEAEGARTAKIEEALAGSLAALPPAIGAATADTAAVRLHRHDWEAMPDLLRGVSTDLELLRLAAGDVAGSAGSEQLAHISAACAAVDRRLERADALWRCAVRSDAPDVPARDAAPLEIPPALDPPAAPEARLAFAGLSARVAALDATVRGVEDRLEAMDARTRPRSAARPSPRPPLFEARRLWRAVLAALCFVAGFLLWIATDPPTGTGVPYFAAIMGIKVLLLPSWRLLVTVLRALLTGLLVFAPIYVFVMPWLGGGPGILVVVFAYSALFAWLGAEKPGLRLGAMIIFAVAAGIANEQSYSIFALVNTAVMLVLAIGVVLLVHALLEPVHAGADAMRAIRRFFAACGGLVSGQPGADAAQLPRLAAAAKAARGRLTPADAPERVDAVLAEMQVLALRLHAFDTERERHRGEDAAVPAALARAQDALRDTLDALSRGDAAPSLAPVRESLSHARPELADRDAALVASVRDLFDVTERAREATANVDWPRLCRARF